MFWGLIMEPNKRYTQTVEKSFHVSMASLDALTADDKIVQVMLRYDDRNYLLCSLKQGTDWQVPLDLNFQEGTQIAFTSNGRGHVHLTGYLIPDGEYDLDAEDLEEEDEEEDDEEAPQLVGNQPKRKAVASPKDSKKAKRLKAAVAQAESSDEEDDDDDDNAEISGEVEDDSDDAEDDDDDEDEDDEEEDHDSEEEKVELKPRQKTKKSEQQQASKKQDKQKMVNGKETKHEATQQQRKKNKAEQQEQKNNHDAQKKKVIQGGVQIEDMKVGSGHPAKSGKFVTVYYIGRLKNGKKFDATTQGEGFKFRLGKGEVIKGWDIGIAGMKCGGKRRITIPPSMAYGAKGSPPTIPGNSVLVFEVELKTVH